jgi:hypothetical protein
MVMRVMAEWIWCSVTVPTALAAVDQRPGQGDALST